VAHAVAPQSPPLTQTDPQQTPPRHRSEAQSDEAVQAPPPASPLLPLELLLETAPLLLPPTELPLLVGRDPLPPLAALALLEWEVPLLVPPLVLLRSLDVVEPDEELPVPCRGWGPSVVGAELLQPPKAAATEQATKRLSANRTVGSLLDAGASHRLTHQSRRDLIWINGRCGLGTCGS